MILPPLTKQLANASCQVAQTTHVSIEYGIELSGDGLWELFLQESHDRLDSLLGLRLGDANLVRDHLYQFVHLYLHVPRYCP